VRISKFFSLNLSSVEVVETGTDGKGTVQGIRLTRADLCRRAIGEKLVLEEGSSVLTGRPEKVWVFELAFGATCGR